jgi:tRNA dimethylallyltransferase
VGKSDAAFEIARRLAGEVVVCDSRQVYDRLDIATNKPDPERMAAIPYHLVGIADPRGTFNVAEFVPLARAAVEDIWRRGRQPVLEGGSMLWADALLDGFTLGGVPPRPERRAELAAMSVEELAALVERLDPDAEVDRRNRPRLVRAIEMLEAAGPPLARLRRRNPPDWDVIRIGLTAGIEVVEQRLAVRSRRQIERGLLEETQAALDDGVPAQAPVLTGIGYTEAVACLRGDLAAEDLLETMIRSNRRYARRQMRWLRRDDRITWIDTAAQEPVGRVLEVLRSRGWWP